MPLYELFRLAREELDKENNNTRVAEQPSSPENDIFELVWEGGQISSQAQSSRARRSPSYRSLPSHCVPSHSPKSRDKDVGVGYCNNTKMGKFGDLDTGLNGIPMSAPSHEVGLNQDEDLMPWLDYTMDGSLPHEYGSSDFLHELSGVTEHDLTASNNYTALDKSTTGNQVFREPYKNAAESGNVSKGCSSAEQVETARHKASNSQLYPPSLVSPRASEITEKNNTSNINQNVPYGEIAQIPSSSSDFPSLNVQKQDPIMPPRNGFTVMNFSHFARPVAVVRANLQNISLKSGSPSARPDGAGIKNKGAPSTSCNPPESTIIDSSGECPKESTMHCQQVVEQSKTDLKPLQPKFLEQNVVVSKQTEPACKESAPKVDQTSKQVLGENGAKGHAAAEKNVEPAVASSSVCSGNGADRCSNDPNQYLKRKSRDTEDSECHSEDAEEESVGVKKAVAGRGTGSKRSRAAEVHNLSERRRRDRINEKMRALQELIPNCNKVDKASMLDEAIEYLKTLQLQVQIMSMGAGFYMHPMMLPAGMQHMHAPHMAPFSPMGMHMGLGMGYGMGMPDMNGGPSRFPMIQVPQMQGTHVPIVHMSGPTALHGMARSNPAGFGLPGQGHPMPMPHAPPVFHFSGGPLVNSSAPGLHACGSAGLVETVDPASTSGLKVPMPNVDSQVKQSNGGRDSPSQMPSQCEAATVGFEQPGLVQNSGEASLANDSGAVNPGKEDNLVIGFD